MPQLEQTPIRKKIPEPWRSAGVNSRADIQSPLKRTVLWLFPIAFLIIFFFTPLTRILALAFDSSAFTAKNFQTIASVTGFTFYQATLSTLLTFALGVPSAILFARFEFKGKALLRALTTIPFMLPTVVVAAAFNSIISFASFLFHPFDFALGKPSPFIFILVAHTFYNTTIVIRIVGNALSSLDPKIEQAARSLGADTFLVWKDALFPLLRPALLSAALLVFMFDFSSFGVILLLGGGNLSTLEVEIYLRVLTYPNLSLAALLVIVQLLFTIIFSILYARLTSQTITQTAPRFSTSRKPKTFKEKLFVVSFFFLLSSFFLLPLISLPFSSVTRIIADRGERSEIQTGFTTDYYEELFINRRGSLFYVPPIEAARNSLIYASITVLFSLALGYPAAYALAKPTRLEKFLDPLVMLPLGASAVMLGLGFIITFGRALASPLFVPIAHTLVALPFVIRALQPAFASIPQRLRDAAAVLGASPFRVWQTVDWRIISRASVSAATFAFTISLGEFGATLLLTRPEYPTLPIAIQRFLSQPGGLNYGQAMAMATILLVLTTVCILLIEKTRTADGGYF